MWLDVLSIYTMCVCVCVCVCVHVNDPEIILCILDERILFQLSDPKNVSPTVPRSVASHISYLVSVLQTKAFRVPANIDPNNPQVTKYLIRLHLLEWVIEHLGLICSSLVGFTIKAS